MSYLGKLYKWEKDENYDEFIKVLGLSGAQEEQILKFKPSIKITKNGDTYTQSLISDTLSKDLTFKSGVEFDEDVRQNVASKTTITVSGDTVTHTQRLPGDRQFTFKKEFSGDKLKETITTNSWDGAAIRHYSA